MKISRLIITVLNFICVALVAAAASPVGQESFVFSELPASGVKEIREFKGTPQGVLAEYKMVIPPFERACYFSTPGQGLPSANRVVPWMGGSDLAQIFPAKVEEGKPSPSRDGMFVLFQLKSGEVLALFPLAGPETMCWLNVNKSGGLQLTLGTLGKAPVNADVPLFAWAKATDAAAACREIWRLVTTNELTKNRTALRSEKKYPEPFEYLGWCSWEQYKFSINSDLLCGAVEQIKKCGVPIRWVLVDDGFQTKKSNQLMSFAPDKTKFPDGWKPLMATRDPATVKWFGLWNCFYGLQGGIAVDNTLGSVAQNLVANTHENPLRPSDAMLPSKSAADAQAFYDAYIDSEKEAGFDFTKIDYQALFVSRAKGLANPVQMHVWNAQALETACQRDMKGLINCMAHNVVCVLNTRYSAVTRCSIDYNQGKEDPAKSHLMQSYANTLWLGQSVWPDHDMFHSSDMVCGRVMSLSKALSGAPVYLSDNPAKFRHEFIRPLVLSDGKLLRPLAPAVPLSDSVFLDALKQPKAYRVIAPLANGSAAVALYNLVAPTPAAPLSATVTAGDYKQASMMLQPYPGEWSLPEEGLVAYDWYAGNGRKLDRPYALELKGFTDALVLLCPINQGWAVVGRADKYLSPAAVENIVATPKTLELRLLEAGPLVIWSASGRPTAEKLTFKELGGGFWKADMPVSTQAAKYVVTR